MPGSSDLFDRQQLTAASEYGSRNGERITHLQIHHATTTSLSGLISLMQPGGRTVSANGALSNTGELVEVVPLANRPFTSATGFDRRSLTVEVCNLTTGDASGWKISDASRERLARLAVDMYRKGLLGSLTRTHIIGHYEVPGTYATACPGPDMRLDWIAARARDIYENGEDVPLSAEIIKGWPDPKTGKVGEAPASVWLRDAGERVAQLVGQVAGLSAAVSTLAANNGADPAVIERAVNAAVEKATPTLAQAVARASELHDVELLNALKALPAEVRQEIKEAL